MRIVLAASVCLILLLGWGCALADSSDLSNGVFIVHAPPSLQYTNSPPTGSWCGAYTQYAAIDTCSEQINHVDTQGAFVWYVLSAWTESKQWCGAQFGLGDYDPDNFVVWEHGACFPSGGLTIPTSGWPGPNEGIALTTTNANWSGNFVPVYWFAGYAYGEDVIPIAPDPDSEFAGWARCDNHEEIAAVALGGLGVLTDGIYACPESELDSGGDSVEQDTSGGDIAGGDSGGEDIEFDFPDSSSTGACCLDHECLLVTQSECAEMSGVFLEDSASCDGDPCSFENSRTTREVYPNTLGGIRLAIFQSADNDTILLHDGTFTGSNNWNLWFPNRDLVIMSISDNPEDCTIDCHDPMLSPHYGIWVMGSPHVVGHTVIKGITLENCVANNNEPCPRCKTGAGVFVGQNSAGCPDSAEVINCVFRNCQALEGGGAIYCIDCSWFSVSACTFDSNTAVKEGGAILSSSQLDPGYCEIQDCYFDGNVAAGGGAVTGYGSVIGSDLDLRIRRCVFKDNVSTNEGPEGDPLVQGGGAIFLLKQAALVDQCTFYGNDALWGGSIYATNDAEVDLTGSIVTASGGEAFRCYDADPPTVGCSDFYGNAGGDWVGCVEGMGTGTNISEFPILCDPSSGDFRLGEDSPCLPDPGGYCVTGMGANTDICPAPQGTEPLGGGSVAEFSLTPSLSGDQVRVTFTVEAGAKELAVLRVVDIAGRVVRSLAVGPALPGRHELTWDGLDAGGAPVPGGVYFLHLRTGGRDRCGRAIIVR